MKKWISALMAALLVMIPALAMAEAAADVAYASYQNEGNGYAINYPEDWTLISKETLQSVMGSLAEGEAQIEGMDTSALEAYKAQIEGMDMVMFMSPDGAVNANITYQAVPQKFTSDVIATQVCPVVAQQFQSMFQDYRALADPQVETVGDYEFVETAGQYTLSGATFVMLQAYHCTDATMYTITYTINASAAPDLNALDAISDDMLASFVPA